MQYRSNIRAVLNNMDEAKETALTAVGHFVRSEAQARTTTGQFQHSGVGGNLKDSTDFKVDMSKKEVIIGNSAEYAVYVELGTGVYAKNGDGRQTPWVYFNEDTGEFVETIGQHPQPFLEPAVMENVPRIKRLISDALKGRLGS
jgi:HK97 gp10 family phage protein